MVITKERIIKPDFGKMHNGRKLVDGNLLIKREIVSGRIIWDYFALVQLNNKGFYPEEIEN